jgi:hypothetical protein
MHKHGRVNTGNGDQMHGDTFSLSTGKKITIKCHPSLAAKLEMLMKLCIQSASTQSAFWIRNCVD